MGIFDQDVDDKVSLAVPQLYTRGIERKEWTQPKFWLYMLDGLYQSVMVWFMTYLLFAPATFNTENGRNIDDGKRIGMYSATAAVMVANLYVLFNTYRWDWLTVLINAISTLLVWFWTGVWTAGTLGFTFHGAASQVYGQLSFWAFLPFIVIVCLLPRFTIKSAQKMFFPRDVDIVREQIRQGKFDYLKHANPLAPPSPVDKEQLILSSSDSDKSRKRKQNMSEDLRPMMSSSIAPSGTSRTHVPTWSNGTADYASSDIVGRLPTRPSTEIPPVIDEDAVTRPEYDGANRSYERPSPTYERARPSFDRARPSYDRARPSYDRFRQSMDRVRPSFEQASDFTSAANLMRMESSGHMDRNRNNRARNSDERQR